MLMFRSFRLPNTNFTVVEWGDVQLHDYLAHYLRTARLHQVKRNSRVVTTPFATRFQPAQTHRSNGDVEGQKHLVDDVDYAVACH